MLGLAIFIQYNFLTYVILVASVLSSMGSHACEASLAPHATLALLSLSSRRGGGATPHLLLGPSS